MVRICQTSFLRLINIHLYETEGIKMKGVYRMGGEIIILLVLAAAILAFGQDYGF
jgi:hypothetical protein